MATILKPGDILAYRNNPDLWAKGIALGEQVAGANPLYVHVGLWVGDGEIAAYGNGVQFAPMPLGYRCDVLRPQVPPAQLAKAITWLRSKVGKTPYAWWDLAWCWVMRRIGWHHCIDWPDGQVICSELGARFLKEAGLDAFPGLYPCEVMPGDFAHGVGLVVVGSLS